MFNEKQLASIAQIVSMSVIQGLSAIQAENMPKPGKARKIEASVEPVQTVSRIQTKAKASGSAIATTQPKNDTEKGVFFSTVDGNGRLRLSRNMFDFTGFAEIDIKGINGVKTYEQQGEANGFRGRAQGSEFGAETGDIVRFTAHKKNGDVYFIATIESEAIKTRKTATQSAPKSNGNGSNGSKGQTKAKTAPKAETNMTPATAKTRIMQNVTVADLLALKPSELLKTMSQMKKAGIAPKVESGSDVPAKTRNSAKTLATTKTVKTKGSDVPAKGWVDMTDEEKEAHRAAKQAKFRKEFEGQSAKFIEQAIANRKAIKSGKFEVRDNYDSKDIRHFLTFAQKKELNQLASRCGWAKELERIGKTLYKAAFGK